MDYIFPVILRNHFMDAIRKGLSTAPITAILGPRQCGKTTLARLICEETSESHYLDLESPETQARLQSPQTALEALQGLVVIDEIQLKPELFSLLRVLSDRPDAPAKFLILGSASPNIIRNTAQTLAGRIHFVDMSGFNLEEIGSSGWRELWIRGGFPRSYLATTEKNSATWRENFIRTFVEKDIPALGFNLPPQTIHRFWTMIAHYHGQTWNGSELGRALGATDKTVRNYVDLLTGTYMVRQLPPWFENIAKRQVKAPKIYLRDSGILHQLLHLPSETALLSYPKYGASWEGFAIEQILRRTGERDAYFWSTHNGAELDLLLMRQGKRFGFEFKYADAPRTTRSMHIAIDTLKLDRLWVVHPGKTDYPLTEKIHVVGIENLYPEIIGQL